MSHATLTALSPLDGRYAAKVASLRPIFSEFGLMHRRVHVEIHWLLALAKHPGIVELAAFPAEAVSRPHAISRDLSTSHRPPTKSTAPTPNPHLDAALCLP